MKWMNKGRNKGSHRSSKDISINRVAKGISIIFRNNTGDYYTESVALGLSDDGSRLYFKNEDSHRGYCLQETPNTLHNKRLNITNEHIIECVGNFIDNNYDLLFDIKLDLHYIEITKEVNQNE